MCVCTGGGATKVCTIFLSLSFDSRLCRSDRRDHITVLEKRGRYMKSKRGRQEELREKEEHNRESERGRPRCVNVKL